MTIDEVTLNRPEGGPGLQCHLWIVSVETLPIRLEAVHLKSALPTGCSRLRVGSRNSWSFPDHFAVPSATGNTNSSPLCVVSTSFALMLQR